MLRPPPKDFYLSTNWLEVTGVPSRTEQLAIIRQHLTNKGRKLTAHGRLAVLHLQSVIDYVRSHAPDARTLSTHHEPEDLDPSHGGIYGYSTDDHLIADLIAQVVQEVHNARG